MAIGPAGALPPHLDFRELRALGTAFVDDCFTGRTSPTLATIEYPGALTVRMEADELYSHAVVYIPEGKPFFAVEPVTNVNDGFTLEAAGQHGTGVFLVQPARPAAPRSRWWPTPDLPGVHASTATRVLTDWAPAAAVAATMERRRKAARV